MIHDISIKDIKTLSEMTFDEFLKIFDNSGYEKFGLKSFQLAGFDDYSGSFVFNIRFIDDVDITPISSGLFFLDLSEMKGFISVLN